MCFLTKNQDIFLLFYFLDFHILHSHEKLSYGEGK